MDGKLIAGSFGGLIVSAFMTPHVKFMFIGIIISCIGIAWGVIKK